MIARPNRKQRDKRENFHVHKALAIRSGSSFYAPLTLTSCADPCYAPNLRIALTKLRCVGAVEEIGLISQPSGNRAANSINCLQTNMQQLATVLLKPGEADRIIAGHPWIYHGSILRLTQPATGGELVQVKDHRQRFLGVGFYNSKSKINVRVLAPDRVEVDQKFFEERIGAALAVRRNHLPDAASFRVVNAESDFLSGLIVDKYEDVLVVQTSSLGMDQRKSLILPVLQQMFSPRAIVERNEV